MDLYKLGDCNKSIHYQLGGLYRLETAIDLYKLGGLYRLETLQ